MQADEPPVLDRIDVAHSHMEGSRPPCSSTRNPLLTPHYAEDLKDGAAI
jgi:hypothetical protein